MKWIHGLAAVFVRRILSQVGRAPLAAGEGARDGVVVATEGAGTVIYWVAGVTMIWRFGG